MVIIIIIIIIMIVIMKINFINVSLKYFKKLLETQFGALKSSY